MHPVANQNAGIRGNCDGFLESPAGPVDALRSVRSPTTALVGHCRGDITARSGAAGQQPRFDSR
jgi:hypothetical protein